MAFLAYFFYNAVIDLVDLSDLLTCFFYFCSTNNLFLCLSFIVCNVLPTCVLWRLHIPHTVTLRLFCNNTLDILRDGRYVVFYVTVQSVSSFILDHYHIIVWMNVYVSGNSDRTVKDSTVCPFIIWIRVSNVCMFCHIALTYIGLV